MASKIEDTLRFMKVMFTHFVEPRRVRDPRHPPRAVGCKRPGARPAVTGKCRSCALSVQTEDRRSEPSTEDKQRVSREHDGWFFKEVGTGGGGEGGGTPSVESCLFVLHPCTAVFDPFSLVVVVVVFGSLFFFGLVHRRRSELTRRLPPSGRPRSTLRTRRCCCLTSRP